MAERIYLLLGSNQGDRLRFLSDACDALLGALQATDAVCSAVYETAAWGLEDQPAFLNQAIGLWTDAGPEAVLECIRQVEAAAQRQRDVHWGQRTLDVDILLFGNRVVDTAELQIPHPQLQNRRFALMPLAEIAPGTGHPVLRATIAELLANCPDHLAVTPVASDPSVHR